MSSGIPMLPINMEAPSVPGDRGDCTTQRTGRTAITAALLLAALLLGERAGAQFTSGVNVVEVYVSVTDAKGQPVKGLTRADFDLSEDGRPQEVSTFAAGDFPLTAALALDASFRMAGRPLQTVKSAAKAFLGALRAEDESLIVGMSSRVEVVADATVPRQRQIHTVEALSAWGTTTLYDSVIASIEAVDAAKGRRALVILSDGDDRYSEASADETLMRARRSNVMVYPVALGKERPEVFAELSAVTGGRSSYSRDYRGVEGILVSIAEELREQYLLGYTPARAPVAGANEWRSIKVAVKRGGVTVRARDGYYVR
jgi:Ca-activated chloride channel family protein